MATHDYVIANGTGAAVRSDLNGALAAIVSNNSSATEPATMYAYQWWADTTTGLLKQRNAANSAWITIGTLASTNLGLLSLAGGTMTGVLAVTAGTAALPGIAVSGDLNTGITSPGADQLAISTGGTVKATVDSSGRLLVGTATGSGNNLFQIQGEVGSSAGIGGIVLRRGLAPSLLVSGSIMGRIDFGPNDGGVGASIVGEGDAQQGTSDYPSRLVFSTTADGAASPTERMRITSDGAITCGPQVSSSDLVGTEACGFVADGVYAPVYKVKSSLTSNKYAALFFNGNGQVGNILMSGSSTAYNTSSDYRLKENVTPVPDGITRLLQLKPSRFNFIANPDHTVDGFLAHEAQAVVPECVTGEKNAVDADGNPVYQGIDQSKLVPLLTAALQEAIAEINALKDRLTAAGIA